MTHFLTLVASVGGSCFYRLLKSAASSSKINIKPCEQDYHATILPRQRWCNTSLVVRRWQADWLVYELSWVLAELSFRGVVE